MTMRLMVENWIGEEPAAALGSPGVDELRWMKPVYPGDTITVESELLSKRRSRTRLDRGLIKSRQTVRNQHGDIVMTMVSNGMYRVADPTAPITD